jgi:hypothetical protein
MLILTVSKLATNSGVTAPDDNILVYQANAAGHFLINSYDLPGISLMDTGFVWAFIRFDDPLSIVDIQPGDFDGDGDVDGADFISWQTNYPKYAGASPADGDADGDGDVDGGDFAIWQNNYPLTPGSGTPPVPEPQAALLALAGVIAMSQIRRQRLA